MLSTTWSLKEKKLKKEVEFSLTDDELQLWL